MIIFGLISSVFDYLTFGTLLILLNANIDQFRTGWFVESVLTEPLTLLVSSLLIAVVTVALPYTPLGALLGLTSMPAYFLAVLVLIVVLYTVSTEVAKRHFYKRTTF